MFEDRIKLESDQSLPLPKRSDSRQKKEAKKRKRQRDYPPPPAQMAQNMQTAQQIAKIQAEVEAKAKQQTVLVHHAALADARRKSETRQPQTSTAAREAVELMSVGRAEHVCGSDANYFATAGKTVRTDHRATFDRPDNPSRVLASLQGI